MAVSLTWLWAEGTNINRHGASPLEGQFPGENAHITVLRCKGRAVTSVLRGGWSDLVKGSLDEALKNE